MGSLCHCTATPTGGLGCNKRVGGRRERPTQTRGPNSDMDHESAWDLTFQNWGEKRGGRKSQAAPQNLMHVVIRTLKDTECSFIGH